MQIEKGSLFKFCKERRMQIIKNFAIPKYKNFTKGWESHSSKSKRIKNKYFSLPNHDWLPKHKRVFKTQAWSIIQTLETLTPLQSMQHFRCDDIWNLHILKSSYLSTSKGKVRPAGLIRPDMVFQGPRPWSVFKPLLSIFDSKRL